MLPLTMIARMLKRTGQGLALGFVALVTAGVLFGKAAYGWAVEKSPTHW